MTNIKRFAISLTCLLSLMVAIALVFLLVVYGTVTPCLILKQEMQAKVAKEVLSNTELRTHLEEAIRLLNEINRGSERLGRLSSS